MGDRIIELMRRQFAEDEANGLIFAQEKYAISYTHWLMDSLYEFESVVASRLDYPRSQPGRTTHAHRIEDYETSCTQFWRAGMCFYDALNNYLYLVPKIFREEFESVEFKARLGKTEKIFNDEFYYSGL